MAIPATPASLTVADSASNCVKLTWANVASETGFYIYVSYDSGVTYERIAQIDADILLWYDTGARADTTYYYKVSAYNADGESALSSAVNTTTPAEDWGTAWVGENETAFDKNAVYLEEVVDQVGIRSSTVLRSEEVADADEEVLRFDMVGSGIAPSDAQYVTMIASDDLSAERVLTAGTGIDVTDGTTTVTLSTHDAEIDHDALSNTHNLTTDIDHNATTNFVANEHLPGIDEDDMASDSDVHVPTQQSVKAYVDATGGAWDGNIDDIDLDGGTATTEIDDTDLFLVDHGANGTMRKVEGSVLKAYFINVIWIYCTLSPVLYATSQFDAKTQSPTIETSVTWS